MEKFGFEEIGSNRKYETIKRYMKREAAQDPGTFTYGQHVPVTQTYFQEGKITNPYEMEQGIKFISGLKNRGMNRSGWLRKFVGSDYGKETFSGEYWDPITKKKTRSIFNETIDKEITSDMKKLSETERESLSNGLYAKHFITPSTKLGLNVKPVRIIAPINGKEIPMWSVNEATIIKNDKDLRSSQMFIHLPPFAVERVNSYMKASIRNKLGLKTEIDPYYAQKVLPSVKKNATIVKEKRLGIVGMEPVRKTGKQTKPGPWTKQKGLTAEGEAFYAEQERLGKEVEKKVLPTENTTYYDDAKPAREGIEYREKQGTYDGGYNAGGLAETREDMPKRIRAPYSRLVETVLPDIKKSAYETGDTLKKAEKEPFRFGPNEERDVTYGYVALKKNSSGKYTLLKHKTAVGDGNVLFADKESPLYDPSWKMVPVVVAGKGAQVLDYEGESLVTIEKAFHGLRKPQTLKEGKKIFTERAAVDSGEYAKHVPYVVYHFGKDAGNIGIVYDSNSMRALGKTTKNGIWIEGSLKRRGLDHMISTRKVEKESAIKESKKYDGIEAERIHALVKEVPEFRSIADELEVTIPKGAKTFNDYSEGTISHFSPNKERLWYKKIAREKYNWRGDINEAQLKVVKATLRSFGKSPNDVQKKTFDFLMRSVKNEARTKKLLGVKTAKGIVRYMKDSGLVSSGKK